MLIQGGPANSGKKRALRETPKQAWACDCSAYPPHAVGSKKINPPYLASCSTCRRKRP